MIYSPEQKAERKLKRQAKSLERRPTSVKWNNAWRFHGPSLLNGFRIISHKVCTRCYGLLLLEQFYVYTRDGRRYARCNECECAAVNQRNAAYKETPYYNSPERLADESNRSYMRRYGITLAERNEMIKEGCAICGTKDGRLFIDHDHKTGVVRGVLCNKHNNGIGMFNDSPVTLHRASLYVLRGAVITGTVIPVVSNFVGVTSGTN